MSWWLTCGARPGPLGGPLLALGQLPGKDAKARVLRYLDFARTSLVAGLALLARKDAVQSVKGGESLGALLVRVVAGAAGSRAALGERLAKEAIRARLGLLIAASIVARTPLLAPRPRAASSIVPVVRRSPRAADGGDHQK